MLTLGDLSHFFVDFKFYLIVLQFPDFTTKYGIFEAIDLFFQMFSNLFSVLSDIVIFLTLFIEINNSALTGDKDELKIGVFSNDELIETTKTKFLAPRSYN